jgi:hypothetical protein
MTKYEYLEIPDGSQIEPGIAFAQAMQLLDLAGSMATDTKDIDRMVKVSTKWLNMGERLAAIMEVAEEEDENETQEEGFQKVELKFGFGPNMEKAEEKEGEADDGASDED